MGVTYKNLRQILIDRKLQWLDIHREAEVANGTIAKINKDEYVKLETLEKIVLFLNKDDQYKKLNIGDLVELKEETH